MDSLRLVLLITGCLIVFGIYWWEVFFKPDPHKNSEILDAVDEFPDLSEPAEIIVPSIEKETRHDYAAIADLDGLLIRPRSEEPATDWPLQTPLSGKEKIATAETALPLKMSVTGDERGMADSDDHDVFIAVQEANEKKQGIAASGEEQKIPENNQNSQDILILYISGPGNILFNGLSISKAADAVGMIYGQRNIFHHFGSGTLHSDQPLFSMANMYEPGSFDSGRMAGLKTKGIALFMYPPASVDVSMIFELFLNTTERIAALLGGEIRTVENKLLDSKEVRKLKARARLLGLEK